MFQPFVDLKKCYYSVMRDVLCNSLIELGVPMKLVGPIKVCLNETYSRINIGKYCKYVEGCTLSSAKYNAAIVTVILLLLNIISVTGTAYWQHPCFLRIFHSQHAISRAMKNNCTCLWVNRRKHPTATHWFCSARMSRRQREKTGKTRRLALRW